MNSPHFDVDFTEGGPDPAHSQYTHALYAVLDVLYATAFKRTGFYPWTK